MRSWIDETNYEVLSAGRLIIDRDGDVFIVTDEGTAVCVYTEEREEYLGVEEPFFDLEGVRPFRGRIILEQ